jgi:hypothetical protein
MKRKIVGILVITLLIATTILPVVGTMNIEKNYELKGLNESDYMPKPAQKTSKFLQFFLNLFNGDWDYWTNPPNMYTLPTGNVGIGTPDPKNKLEVAGNVEAQGFTINGIPVGTSTDTYWSAQHSYIYYNSGNVGIGTIPDSAYQLHLTGTIRAKDVITERNPWIDSRAYSSYNDIMRAIVGNEEKTILVSNRVNLLKADVGATPTISDNIHLWFTQEGSFYIEEGVSLYIWGKVTAPSTQIFYGNGKVVGCRRNSVVHAEWWGASEENKDNSVAINKAIMCVENFSSGGIVEIKPYTYKIMNTINLRRGVFLVSPSYYSNAQFRYYGEGTAISMGDGSDWRAAFGGLRNIHIVSYANESDEFETIGLDIRGKEYDTGTQIIRDSATDIVIENAILKNFDTAIHIDDYSEHLTFRNVRINGGKDESDLTSGIIGIKIDSKKSDLISFYDCTINQCNYAIEAPGFIRTFRWVGGDFHQITNDKGYHAARFTGEQASIIFEGLHVEGCWGFIFSSPSVFIHTVKNCYITGCNLNYPEANDTIVCRAACGEIIGNYFDTATVGSDMRGDTYTINVSGSSNVIVAGNAWIDSITKRLAPYENTGDSIILVDSALRITNSSIELDEIAVPDAPDFDKARIYLVEDALTGKTKLMIRFPGGKSQPIVIEE